MFHIQVSWDAELLDSVPFYSEDGLEMAVFQGLFWSPWTQTAYDLVGFYMEDDLEMAICQ